MTNIKNICVTFSLNNIKGNEIVARNGGRIVGREVHLRKLSDKALVLTNKSVKLTVIECAEHKIIRSTVSASKLIVFKRNKFLRNEKN